MSAFRKLFRKSSQVLTDSGISTCYSAPQARKNRIPSYFEQLEPRQLLSGTQVDTSGDATAPVVAESFSSDASSSLSSVSDLTELLRQAALPDFSDISSAIRNVPGLEDLDLDGLDLSAVGQEVLDHLPRGGFFESSLDGSHDLADSAGLWLSLWSESVTVSGSFYSNATDCNYNAVAIMASGNVTLNDVSFTGIEYITIRAASVTFDSGTALTLNGGELTISAMDYARFTSGSSVTGDGRGDLSVTASNSITMEAGSGIDGLDNLTLSAPSIEIGESGSGTTTAIDVGGDFKAEAKVSAHLNPLFSSLPIKIASGEARISVGDALINAKSVSITATVDTATTKQLPTLGELTDNQYLSLVDTFLTSSVGSLFKTYLGVDVQKVLDPVTSASQLQFAPAGLGTANQYLDTLASPLSDTLNELYQALEISAPVLITYGSATADVVIDGATSITTTGDTVVTASTSVANTQTKNSDLFGFVLAINKSNASVTVQGHTTIDAGGDAVVGAASKNTNSVTLTSTYNPATATQSSKIFTSKTTKSTTTGTTAKKNTYAMAIAIGVNEAQASVLLGVNVAINAGRDITVTSNTTESLTLAALANATSSGNLAIGLALNFGGAKSYTTVNCPLTAQGSVKAASNVESTVTTSSSTNIPSKLDETAPVQPPAQPQDAVTQVKGISSQVSAKLTNLILAMLPTNFATAKLQQSRMGLGVALGFVMHDAEARTAVGGGSVITALGAVESGLVTEGRGAVILDSVSNTTPIIKVSASSVADQVTQSATRPPTTSTTNPPASTPTPATDPATVAALTEAGVVTTTADHHFQTGDQVVYHCSDPAKAITGLVNGQTYTVTVYNGETRQFVLRSADGATVRHFRNIAATDWAAATHTFTKATATQDNGVVSVSADSAVVKAANIRNGAVTCAGHNFKIGDTVTYTSATPATGLTNGTRYKIFAVTDSSFTLADAGGNKITIGAAAAGSQHTFIRYVAQTTGAKATATKSDIGMGQVNVANTFAVGDILTYTSSNTADAVTGLTSGQKYTVASRGATFFTLKGADGKVITLTQNSDQATLHTFTRTAPATTGATVVVNGSQVEGGNRFKAASIPFKVNDKVTYSVAAGGTALTGMTVGQTYTVKTVGQGYFQLADGSGNLVNVSTTGAAGATDHIFTRAATPPARLDKGVSIAAGITVFTNTASTTVASGARIVHNTLVEITSDANYKTPTATRTLATTSTVNKQMDGAVAQLPIDFLQEAAGSVQELASSIDDAYLDAQQSLGSLFGVDAISFQNSDTAFFMPNSYVYAVTAGAKTTSTAASFAYIGQDNTSEALVADDVSIVRTGGVTDAAVNAASGTVRLSGDYNGYSGYVTYEAGNASTDLAGLDSGVTYWGVVDASGNLSLYTGQGGSRISVGKSGDTAVAHYFLFQQQPVGGGASSAIDADLTEESSTILRLNDAHGFATGDVVTVGDGLGLDTDALYMVFVQSDTELAFKKITDGRVEADFATLTLSAQDGYAITGATDGQRTDAGLSVTMTTAEYQAANAEIHNPFAGFASGDVVTYEAADATAALSGLTSGQTYTLILTSRTSFALKSGAFLVSFSLNDAALETSHSFSKAGATAVIDGGELAVTNSSGVSVGTVSTGGRTVTVADEAGYAFRSGDILTYTCSAEAIDGLESGKEYMVEELSAGTFALYAYENGEATGDAVTVDYRCLGLDGSATHTFTLTQANANALLSLDADSQVSDPDALFIGSHDFQTGDTVELAGLALDAGGAAMLNADGTPMYNALGTFTVVRLSDCSVKLLDARGVAYDAPVGESSGLDDYRLTLVSTGSPMAADGAHGGALTILSDTLAAGDAVVYRADGRAAAGLTNGATYYVSSVTDNGDGTSAVTLSASKGGPALSVTLTDAAHMLTLKTARTYAAGADGSGGVVAAVTTGIYDGMAVSVDAPVTVRLADGSGEVLARGSVLYASVDDGGVIRLAGSEEAFLAGSFLDVTDFSGTLTPQGATHTFNQNTVTLGAYIFETNASNGLIDGSVVTVERADGALECYTVNTYGETAFTLTDLETGLRVDRDYVFDGDATISLNRPVDSVTFKAENLVDNPLYVTKAGHGFVTGQALEYSAGSGQGTYYVIVRDADTFYLADSLEEAYANNARTEELPGTGGTLKKKAQQYGIFIQATSSDKTVNLTGKMGTGKGAVRTTTATAYKKAAFSSDKITQAVKGKISPQRTPDSASGAGGALQILNLNSTTTARLGTSANSAGALVMGSGLSITANSDNGVIAIVQAGATGQLDAISGTSSVLLLDNATTASLGVGSGRVTLGDALGADGVNSLLVQASDKTIYTQLSAAISSGQTAIGGTVFVDVVNRDTYATIDGATDLSGRVLVLGSAEVNALNTGRGVSVLIGGSHASPAQQQASTNTTGQTPQTGGSTGQSGVTSPLTGLQTVQSTVQNVLPQGTDKDANLTDAEKKKRDEQKQSGNYLSLLTGSADKAASLGSVLDSGLTQANTNVTGLTQGTGGSGQTPPPQQSQSPAVSEAYTGEIFVGYSSEETKAMVRNLSSLVVAGFVAKALDDTKQITVAGAFSVTSKSKTKSTDARGKATFSQNESSSSSKAGAGSVVVSVTDRETEASVDDVAILRATDGDVDVSATDDGFALAGAAGLAGSSSGSGYGGTLLINARLSDVTAYVADCDLTVEQGALSVSALKDVTMITVAGGGGFGDAKGVGLSLGVNVLAGDATAYIDHGVISVSDSVSVTAMSGTGTDRSGIDIDDDNPEASVSGLDSIDGGYNLIAIGASAGIGLGGNSLAGTVVTNIVTSETTAFIGDGAKPTTVLADGSVSVLAADKFGILSIGGSLGLSGKAKADPANSQNSTAQKSTSVGAVLAINVIHSTSAAYARNVTVGKRTASAAGADVSVTSLSSQQILSIAGAAAAAQGDAAAVTLALNVISAGAAASLADAAITGRTLSVRSGNESTILSIAGGIGLSTGNSKAAAIAANVIAGADIPALGPDSDTADIKAVRGSGSGNLDVTASVSGSSIDLSGDVEDCMVVLAETSSSILSIAAGIGVSTGSEGGASQKTNLAGAATINVIARNVSASVANSNILAAGKVSVVARDYIMSGGTQKGSRILSIAGQVGVGLGGSQAGAALAVNVIANDVAAGLTGSDLTETGVNGGLDVMADSIARILSITGSVAVSLNSEGNASAKSASIAVNVIDKDVTATISGAKSGASKTVTGPVRVRAADSSQILGISATVAYAAGSVEASSLGGTVAVNVVNSAQTVSILDTALSADGLFSIKAEGRNSISAVNLGLAGTSLAVNPNVIVNETAVSIVRSSLGAASFIVESTQAAAGSSVTELWTKKYTSNDATLAQYLDTTDVDFNTNILSLNLNAAGTMGEANSAVAGAVAVNVVTSTAKVEAESSTLYASGADGLHLSAVNSAVIRAVAIGAAVTVGASSAVSGGLSSNTITGGAYAAVTASTFRAPLGEVSVSALDNADILALAVNAAVSTGGTAVGLYQSVNVISVDSIATISGSYNSSGTFVSGGNFSVTARDTSTIWAFTVAASMGTGTAASLANNTNVIVGTVEASITSLLDGDGNLVSALSGMQVGGGLTVEASSSTQIVNVAIGAAVGMGSGAAVQATASENVIKRSVNAGISGVGCILVGGDLVVRGFEAQPGAIGDWRLKSYVANADIGNVDTSGFQSASDNDTGVGVADGGEHSVDPNAALFNPQSGIFSLVVSVAAAAGGGAAVSGALNFNWLERDVNATVRNVNAVKFTGGGSMTVSAQASASAFGGVLSLGGGTGSAAVGAAAAINILNNKTQAILADCTVGGWSGGAWNDSRLRNVTVEADNTSGAIALAVGVGATAGSAGVGASLTMNLGMSPGKKGFTSTSATDRATELSGVANHYYTDLLTNGSGSYTSDSSALGGESAEAGIRNTVIHSSGALVVEALQNSAFLSIDLAVGAGSTAGVAGAVSLNLLSINSAAYIINPATSGVTAGSVKVDAQTGGKAWAFLIGVGAGGTVGATGLLSLSRVGGTAQAYTDGGSITTLVGGLTVNAYGKTDMLTVGVAIGAGGTAAASGSVALAFAGNTVTADVTGTVLDLAGDLAAVAENTTSVITTSLGVSGSGTAAGAGGLAINLATWGEAAAYDPANSGSAATSNSDGALEYIGDNSVDAGFVTRARVESESIKAANITLRAMNKSSYVAALIMVAGSGSAAGAGGLVLNLMDSASTAALVDKGAVTASGAVSVTSENSTKLWATMASVAGSGAAAGAGSLALNLSDVTSTAEIAGLAGAAMRAGSVEVSSSSAADLYALALAVAASGAAAGAGSIAINASTNPTRASIAGPDASFVLTVDDGGSVKVLSRNDTTLVAGSVGVAASGTAAGGGSISINVASKGGLADTARQIRATDAGTTRLRTGGEELDENAGFSGVIEKGVLHLSDAHGDPAALSGHGVTNDTHYLVLTDEDGGETLYSFSLADITKDGGIDAAALVNTETGAHGLASVLGDAAFTYRSNPYGAPTYTSDAVAEVASSTATVDGATITGENLGGGVVGSVDLDVAARSGRTTVSVAAGVAASGGASGYGSVNVAVSANLTQAVIQNSVLALGGGDLSVTAENVGGSYGVGLAVAAGAYGAGGAVVSVSVDSGDTRAELLDTHVVSVNDVTVDATTTLTAFNLNLAAAGAIGAGAATVATTVVKGDTLAQISGGSITATGDVAVHAVMGKSTATTDIAAVAGGKSGLSDTLNTASTQYKDAERDANNTDADTPDEDTEATSFANSLSATGILSVSIAASGGVVAASGALAVNHINGNVQAVVRNTSITAQDFTVSSGMASSVQSYVVSAAVGGIGLAGSLSINSITGKTTAEATCVSQVLGGVASVTAIQNLTITGLAVVAAAGAGAGGFGLVTNTLSGDVSALILGGDVSAAGGLAVTADRTSHIHSYAIGVSLGLGGAFAGGVAVNTLTGSTTAGIDGDTGRLAVSNTGAVTVRAHESTTSTTLGVQAAGGFGISLAAGVAVTTATGNVKAYVNKADFTTVASLAVTADSEADLTIKGVGAAVGAAAAGIVTSVISLTNSIAAYVKDSTLSGVGAVDVLGNGDWHLYGLSVAGAAGIISGSGAFTKVSVDGSVDAYLSGVRLANVGSVDIKATGTPRQVRALSIAPAISILGSVGAADADVDITPTIRAYADDISVRTFDSSLKPADFTVSAELKRPAIGYSAEAVGYALAAGLLLGVSGTSATVHNSAVVKAYVRDLALDSRLGSLSVHAKNEVSLNAEGLGVGVSYIAGVGVAAGSIRSHSTTLAFVSGERDAVGRKTADIAGDFSVVAESAVYTDQNTTAGAGSLGLAIAAGTARQTLIGTTRSAIGVDLENEGAAQNKVVFNAKTLDLRAESAFYSNMYFTADAVALLGGSGGTGILNIAADTKAMVGDRAELTAESLGILSENVIVRGQSGHENGADSTAVGIITVNAGGSATSINADSSVLIGDDARLTHTGASTKDPTGLPSGERMTIQAFNVLDVNESLAFTAGGALNLAVVVATVTADLNATVDIGERAVVRTTNSLGADIVIHAGSYDGVNLEAGSNLWGLASAGVLKAKAEVTSTNKVNVHEGALIYSTLDLAMGAGRMGYKYATDENVDAGGTGHEIGDAVLYMSGDIYDRTALPLSTGVGSALLWTQSNLITVDQGAELMSRGNTELYAQQGSFDIKSHTMAHNWTTTIFGKTDYTKKESTFDNTVAMNGTVTAGVDNIVSATIKRLTSEQDWNDAVGAGIVPDAEVERVEAALAAFQSALGYSYFEYLADPDGKLAGLMQSGLSQAQGFDDARWAEIVGAMKDNLEFYGVTTLISDVFTTLCHSSMDALKNLQVSAADFSGLLGSLDLGAAEALYTDEGGNAAPALFWQSILQGDADLQTKLDHFSALEAKGYDFSALQADNPAAARALSSIASSFGVNATAVNGMSQSDWVRLQTAYATIARLNAGQSAAIDTLVNKLGGYARARVLWAAYGQLTSAGALEDGANLTADGWRWMLDAVRDSHVTVNPSTHAETVAYDADWTEDLENAYQAMDGEGFDYGQVSNADKAVLDAFLVGRVDAGERPADGEWATYYKVADMTWVSASGEAVSLETALQAVSDGLSDTLLGQLESVKENPLLFDGGLLDKVREVGGDAANTLLGGTTLSQGQLALLGLLQVTMGAADLIGLYGVNAYDTYCNAYSLNSQVNVVDATTKAYLEAELGYYVTGKNADQLTYEVSRNTEGNALYNEYRRLQRFVEIYGKSDASSKLILKQMKAMQADLAAYGFGTIKASGAFVLGDGSSVSMVTVKDMLVSKGNVNVYADTVSGHGTLEALDAASLTVTSSIATLYADNLTISSKEGGKVNVFNGEADATVTLKSHSGFTAAMTVRQENAHGTLLAGDLYNLSGTTTLNSEGDMSIVGDVFARTMVVAAKGNLTINLSEDGSLYNVGGQPISISGDKSMYNIKGLTLSSRGSLRVLGDINISANYINVNGLIQSGVKAYDIDITNSLHDGYMVIRDDGTAYSAASITSSSKYSFKLYSYDSHTDTYTIDPIYAAGGHVYITGTVFNTNSGMGEIAVYNNPDVDISNTSQSTIVVQGVDTGSTEIGGVFLRGDSGQAWTRLSGSYRQTNERIKYNFLVGSSSGLIRTYELTVKKWQGWDAFDWLIPDISNMDLVNQTQTDNTPLDDTGGYVTNNIGAYSQVVKNGGYVGLSNGPLVTGVWYAGYTINQDAGSQISGSYVRYVVNMGDPVEQSNDPQVTWHGALLWRYQSVQYKTVVTQTRQTVFWVQLDTDMAIKVAAPEQGAGSISINSVGSVVLDGAMNGSGDISINSSRGDVSDAAESWINSSSGSVSVTATLGSVGREKGRAASESSTLKIVAGGSAISLTAGRGDVYARFTGGDATVAVQAGGTASLSSDRVLYGEISAPEITLSAFGGLGSAASALQLGNQVDPSAGSLVTAAVTGPTGDIHLSSQWSDLGLVRVSAPGAVDIVATGALTDANTRQAVDQQDLARLEGMWARLGILASDDPAVYAQQVSDRIDAECGQVANVYHNHHDFMEAVERAGGRDGYAAQLAADSSYGFASQEEAAAWIDENIANLEGQLNDFDPSLLTSAYDAGLTVTRAGLTQAQADALREQAESSLWDKATLMSKVTDALFGGTTTTLYTEVANILARDINLRAGAIGQYDADRQFVISGYAAKLAADSFTDEERFYLDYATVGEKYADADADTMTIRLQRYVVENYQAKLGGTMEFTERDRFYIWTSESSDRTYDEAAGTLTIRLTDDLNVLLTGGRLDLYAEADALIGTGVRSLSVVTRQDLTVGTATAATGELRIKADGSLYTTPGGALSSGTLLVAEGSNGTVGTADNPLTLGAHGAAVLRAPGDIHVIGAAGTGLTIQSVSTDGRATIVAAEDVTFANDALVLNGAIDATSGKGMILRGNTVTVGDGVSLKGETLAVRLDGLGVESWIRIADGASLRAADGSPVTVVGSALDSDALDFSGSELDGSWTVDGAGSGSFSNGNLDLAFSAIEKIAAGRGDDVVHLTGSGVMHTVSLGDGDGTVDAGGLDSRATWSFDSNTGRVTDESNAIRIAALTGVGEIVGSGHGDELSYDDAQVPAEWVVPSGADNAGTLNGMKFSGITTATQVSPGSRFDLSAHMNTIDVQAGPSTIYIHTGGYFDILRNDGGAIIVDVRPSPRPTTVAPPVGPAGDVLSGSATGFTPVLMPLPGTRGSLMSQTLGHLPEIRLIPFPPALMMDSFGSSSSGSGPASHGHETPEAPEEERPQTPAPVPAGDGQGGDSGDSPDQAQGKPAEGGDSGDSGDGDKKDGDKKDGDKKDDDKKDGDKDKADKQEPSDKQAGEDEAPDPKDRPTARSQERPAQG